MSKKTFIQGLLGICAAMFFAQSAVADTTQNFVKIVTGSVTSLTQSLSNFTLAIDDQGRLWGWGANPSNILGAIGARSDVPVLIDASTNWSDIQVGYDTGTVVSVFGVKSDGTAWSWGNNALGRLGIGEVSVGASSSVSTPTQIAPEIQWSSVHPGNGQTAFATTFGIDIDGNVYGWGNQYFNWLGDGVNGAYMSYTPTPTLVVPKETFGDDRPVSVVGPSFGNAILTENGSVYTHQSNHAYARWLSGIDGNTWHSEFTKIDTLPPVEKLTASGMTYVALTPDGDLYMFGGNVSNLSNWTTIATGDPPGSPAKMGEDKWLDVAGSGTYSQSAFLAVREDGTLWGWGTDSRLLGTNAQYAPVQIGTGNNFEKVFASRGNLVAVTTDGEIYTRINGVFTQIPDVTYVAGIPIEDQVDLPPVPAIDGPEAWGLGGVKPNKIYLLIETH